MKRTIVLVISIIMVLASAGTFAYLYYQNQEIKKEVESSKESITKLEDTISNEKKEIDDKKDEYEKLKEKVQENMKELEIWQDIKEKLNQSLS